MKKQTILGTPLPNIQVDLKSILGRPFGKRENQEDKYTGFLGEIELPDGTVMTEKSISVDIDGKETLIPSIVPTNKKFLKDIAQNNMTKQITDNAINHAMKRIKQGKSPFAEPGEFQFEGKKPIRLKY